MLAKTGQLQRIPNPSDFFIQPKLNGIRALWNPEQQELQTRNGRVITSMNHIKDEIKESSFSHLPLDGGLIYSHSETEHLDL